jgi:haloalkane dehalogenase
MILKALPIPVLTAFSDSDPVTRGGEKLFKSFRGAKGQPHVTLHGHHFIQEDAPKECVNLIVEMANRERGRKHHSNL